MNKIDWRESQLMRKLIDEKVLDPSRYSLAVWLKFWMKIYIISESSAHCDIADNYSDPF